MNIACCDFQCKDKDAYVVFVKNLNHIIAYHRISYLQCKGFMVDSTQANWNAMRIVYSSGDFKVPIKHHQKMCYFY